MKNLLLRNIDAEEKRNMWMISDEKFAEDKKCPEIRGFIGK
jgi:hypothetical protein